MTIGIFLLFLFFFTNREPFAWTIFILSLSFKSLRQEIYIKKMANEGWKFFLSNLWIIYNFISVTHWFTLQNKNTFPFILLWQTLAIKWHVKYPTRNDFIWLELCRINKKNVYDKKKAHLCYVLWIMEMCFKNLEKKAMEWE